MSTDKNFEDFLARGGVVRMDLNALKDSLREAHVPGGCSMCGSLKMAPIDFVDEMSRREAKITGTCQVCQDEIFREPEDDDDE